MERVKKFLLSCVLALGSVIFMIPSMLFVSIGIVILSGLFWFSSEETQKVIINMVKDMVSLLKTTRIRLLELEIEKLR
jgi:hypothetical protein